MVAITLDGVLAVVFYGLVAILVLMVIVTMELVGLVPTFSLLVKRDTTYIPTSLYTKLVQEAFDAQAMARRGRRS